MELPSGGTNAGNVTFLMDRTEGRSSPGRRTGLIPVHRDQEA